MFFYRGAAFLAVFLPAIALLVDRGQAQDMKAPPAEPGRPYLISVMPPATQIGQPMEIIVSGGDILNAESLVFSDDRIKAEKLGAVMIEPSKDKAKDKMKAPQPTGEVKFRVSVPAGVKPGLVDVRIVGPSGLSNSRSLVVSEVQELLEKEPNNDVDQAQRITVDTAVNGTIAQNTDVDYTVFSGKKGQAVVVSCLTSSIDSRLQADLQIYDTEGRPIGQNRNYKGDDALVSAVLPRDGDYFIRLAQFTYTSGGPDHFYRLHLSSAPWIDAVYPPVIAPGTTAALTIYGRNLPGGKIDPKAIIDGQTVESATIQVSAPKAGDRLDFDSYLPPAASALDGFAYQLRNNAGSSNSAFISYARAPITLDNAANDSLEKAQMLTLPTEVVGRIDQRRDRDWYSFSAKKGEVVSIEAFADRLGSPVDLYFGLYDDKGKLINEFDENTELLHPVQFYTRTEDPQRLRFEAPADGTYHLMVSTRESFVQAGPRDIYRIYIGPERPDFRLVVMPAAPYHPAGAVVPRGGEQVLSVFVWRKDGFEGPIDLRVEGLPKGVTAEPQSVGPRTKAGAVVLKADANAAAWAGNIRIIGTAKIGGKEVSHEARSASITWGAGAIQQDQAPNSPLLSRMDRGMTIAVSEAAPFRLLAKADKGKELVGSPGEKLTFTVTVERRAANFKGPVTVSIVGLPQNASLSGMNNKIGVITNLNGDKGEAKFTVDLKKDVPAGKYTLIPRGQLQYGKSQNQGNQKLLAGVPIDAAGDGVALTILPTEVAKVKVTPAEAKAKAGETVTFNVQIERLNDFDGPIQLQVVFPDGTKYVSADPVKVDAGKSEAEVRLKVTDNAKALALPKVIIKATARVGESKDLISEGRLSLTVVK